MSTVSKKSSLKPIKRRKYTLKELRSAKWRDLIDLEALPIHPSEEELLHAMLECPQVLDQIAKTSRERLRFQVLLCQWQQAGYPDLKSWRKTKVAHCK